MQTTPSIRRATLRQKEQWFTWFGAVVLLVVGFIGTIVTANGGWDNVLSGKITANGTIIAVILQIGLTISQWTYKDRRLTMVVSRAIDTALTGYGYGSIFANDTINYFDGIGVHFSWFVFWYLIMTVALGVSWYPEYRLVRD